MRGGASIGKTRQRVERRLDAIRYLDAHAELARGIRQPSGGIALSSPESAPR
jgi:hypothetical protein